MHEYLVHTKHRYHSLWHVYKNVTSSTFVDFLIIFRMAIDVNLPWNTLSNQGFMHWYNNFLSSFLSRWRWSSEYYQNKLTKVDVSSWYCHTRAAFSRRSLGVQEKCGMQRCSQYDRKHHRSNAVASLDL